ncbi:Mlp family lipoprotein [Borrelia miyamotoi]|nr:Mlp family lipoprotein [Borrelia miyamotoi]
MKLLSQNKIEESQNIVNKYPNFRTWLSNNSTKKKKLANAFTTIYNFLEEQRLLKSSNLSSEQLIINTLNCFSENKVNPQCNNTDYAYIDSNLHLKEVFHYLIMSLHIKNTNEEIFKNMQDILLSAKGYLNALIKSFEYEKILRPKLNYNQKQGLNFLKQALSAHNLKKVLRSNEDKIKAVLDHMYNEMTKCNGDDVNKNTFKSNVNRYFNTLNHNQLDKFKDQVISTCGFGNK